jgi:hypothetical protein
MTATSSIENDMAELDVNKVLGTWLDNPIPQAYEQRTLSRILRPARTPLPSACPNSVLLS